MPLIPVLILAWPLLEIAAFIIVGAKVGVLGTLVLTIATSALGALLLRLEGTRALTAMFDDLRAERKPKVADAALIALGGALLVLPGFVSDIVGLALFLPFVRGALIRYLAAHADWVVVERSQTRVYDLDPSEWSATRDEPKRPDEGGPRRLPPTLDQH